MPLNLSLPVLEKPLRLETISELCQLTLYKMPLTVFNILRERSGAEICVKDFETTS